MSRSKPIACWSTVTAVAFFIVAFTLPASALEESESQVQWSCTERGKYLSGTRVAHVELKQPASFPGVGEILASMMDMRRTTLTRVQGLEIRWEWNDAGEWDWNDPDTEDWNYRYAFIITPTGEGRYVDSERRQKQADGSMSVKPQQLYTCHRTAASP